MTSTSFLGNYNRTILYLKRSLLARDFGICMSREAVNDLIVERGLRYGTARKIDMRLRNINRHPCIHDVKLRGKSVPRRVEGEGYLRKVFRDHFIA